MNLKKICIDTRWMTGNLRGMGKYASTLIKPVANNCIGYSNTISKLDIFEVHSFGFKFYPLWEQISLPLMARRKKIDLIVCPYNTAPIYSFNQQKIIVVIHDLIFLRPFSELPLPKSNYQKLGLFYRRLIVPHIIKKADVILTVSQYTKSEILKRYDVKNVEVIPNTLSDDWFVESYIPLENRQNYILTVSGESPSKNLQSLLVAFSKVSDLDVKLVIIGVKEEKRKIFLDLALELNIQKRIIFESYLADEDIKIRYRNARGCICASLFEGFGIPLIEAMASGTPLSYSNTTSMPEIVGDTGFSFEPRDIESIVQGIEYLLTDHEIKTLNLIRAKKRAERFRESNVISEFDEFWNEI